MEKFFDKFRKKKVDFKLNTTGMKNPETLGYFNPLWSVNFSHKGKDLGTLPLFFVLMTYLKDYGFEPETKLDPPICVTIDIGGPIVKFPLTTTKKIELGYKYSVEEALEKGLLYKSQPA